jgi:HEAT repeat protein
MARFNNPGDRVGVPGRVQRSLQRRLLIVAGVFGITFGLPCLLGIVVVLGKVMQGEPLVNPANQPSVEKAVAELKSPNPSTRQGAANWLARAKPDPAHPEVAEALRPLVRESDPFTRPAALQALTVWGSEEDVPLLIEVMQDPKSVLIHKPAIEALARFKSEQATAALAKQLGNFADRADASAALQRIGPEAEPAVLPYLDNADWGIPLEAMRILAKVGTEQSVPALEKLAKGPGPGVAMEAKATLDAIKRRK